MEYVENLHHTLCPKTIDWDRFELWVDILTQRPELFLAFQQNFGWNMEYSCREITRIYGLLNNHVHQKIRPESNHELRIFLGGQGNALSQDQFKAITLICEVYVIPYKLLDNMGTLVKHYHGF